MIDRLIIVALALLGKAGLDLNELFAWYALRGINRDRGLRDYETDCPAHDREDE